MPGYHTPIRKDRSAHGGGVAVWVKAGLGYEHLDHIQCHDHEIIWLSVTTQSGQKVVICAAYRPGSCSETDLQLLEYLDNTLEASRTYGSNVIVTGDFNVHNAAWLCSNKTTRAGEYAEDICCYHGLSQHVDVPTRGDNTLDLVMSDFPSPATVKAHPPIGLSDHAVLQVDFPVKLTREPKTSRRVWRYHRADWERLAHFYRTTDWESMLGPEPDLSCDNITKRILEGMAQFIPNRVISSRPSDEPWWTPECTAAVNTKRQMWHQMRSNPDSADKKANYRTAAASARSTIQRNRERHITMLRQKLTTGSLRDKEWWSTIKCAGGKGRSADIPTLRSADGTEYTTSQEKAKCLGQYFADKCSLGPQDFNEESEFPFVQPRSQSRLLSIRFRPAEVHKLLRALDPSKASGPDAVPGRVLKANAEHLAVPLCLLFRQCMTSGTQPQSWKVASVVPVHKKRSKSAPSNYRPISLLSLISKTMEAVVNRALTNFLERNNILSNHQFGFRRGLGPADLLTGLHHQWSKIAAAGGAVRIVAVDIAGAFDKVSHAGVLHKAKAYGVSGNLLKWLHSYLADRRIQAVVSGQTSPKFRISSGVPQGSILGPTLFLLYVNDMEDHLPATTQLAIYADDTTLYQCIPSLTALPVGLAQLQNAVDALAEWGQSWKIAFEPTKSQVLTISHHRQPWPIPPATFNGVAIEEVEELKLLGVLFDRSLSFRSHIRQVAVRGHQRLGFMRKALPILDSKAKYAVYRGFVRPVLEYCPLSWLGASQSTLNQLDRVQHRALKLIGPGSYLPSLTVRRQVAALTFLYKLHWIDGPPILTTMTPPRAVANQHRRSTRHQQKNQHQHQLAPTLPAGARNSALRSFPHATIQDWNRLPSALLRNLPTQKGMQAFKEGAYKSLRSRDWRSATDAL